MIKLFQHSSAWGLASASPFCLKLETYLKASKIPYKNVPNADIRKSPKGKMPYIEHEGKLIGDSGFIIKYLEGLYGNKLDAHLSEEEKGIALSITRMIEDNLYWISCYSRWVEEKNWTTLKSTIFAAMPALLRSFVPYVLRKKVKKQLVGQGFGLHSRDEIYQIGKENIQALSQILGEKKYIMGDQFSSVDAVVFGALANIIWHPIESPIKKFGNEKSNLVNYCKRIQQEMYPELAAS
jgi:glutathione S-transferase